MPLTTVPLWKCGKVLKSILLHSCIMSSFPPSVSVKSRADSNFTHLQQLELLHAHDTADTAVQNNLSLHLSRETTLHFPGRDRMIGTRTAKTH